MWRRPPRIASGQRELRRISIGWIDSCRYIFRHIFTPTFDVFKRSRRRFEPGVPLLVLNTHGSSRRLLLRRRPATLTTPTLNRVRRHARERGHLADRSAGQQSGDDGGPQFGLGVVAGTHRGEDARPLRIGNQSTLLRSHSGRLTTTRPAPVVDVQRERRPTVMLLVLAQTFEAVLAPHLDVVDLHCLG